MAQQINKLLPALACLWAVSSIYSVQATDINLSGIVIASACIVDTGTKEQTVTSSRHAPLITLRWAIPVSGRILN